MFTCDEKLQINFLIKKLKNEDMVAFEQLYKLMYGRLKRFLIAYGCDNFTSDDVISSTFITVFEKSKLKMYYKNCCGWIIKIAINHYKNIRRKINHDESFEHIEYEANDLKYENFSEHVDFESLMNNLTTQDKTLVEYKFYFGLTNRIIAQKMNVSESTIIRRCKQLQKYIEDGVNYE